MRRVVSQPPGHRFLRNLLATVALLAFFVVVVEGLRNGVRVTTILYRSAAAVFAIRFLTYIIIRVLGSYEEIQGGKT
jgi:hypothetical protein